MGIGRDCCREKQVRSEVDFGGNNGKINQTAVAHFFEGGLENKNAHFLARPGWQACVLEGSGHDRI